MSLVKFFQVFDAACNFLDLFLNNGHSPRKVVVLVHAFFNWTIISVFLENFEIHQKDEIAIPLTFGATAYGKICIEAME